MIRMQQPSLCLNAHDVPGPHYKMWRTVNLAPETTVTEVVYTIVKANTEAMAAHRTPLRNILFNAHGYSGKVSTGGKGKPGIDRTSVGLFGLLKPLNVGTIWLLSCLAVKDGPGQRLALALAAAAGTQVIAADSTQQLGAWDGYRYYLGLDGNIDDFEGTVYCFTPKGTVHRNVDPAEMVQTVEV